MTAVYFNADDFDPDSLPPGDKYSFFLRLYSFGDGEKHGFPVLVASGRLPGKTLVVLAGVHGDELEGVQAIHDTFQRLDPAVMTGRLIAIPVSHLAAYQSGLRSSPIDSLNLARTFPGLREGTATERIAYYLSEKIIAHADFFIDLHSAGLTYRMPTMVGYDASQTEWGRASQEAAYHFGMPVMWGHEELAPGRSLGEAARREIPWLYTESPGGGRVANAALAYYINGLQNLLRFLKIIPGDVKRKTPETHLIGDGDLDQAMFANSPGFFVALVDLLDVVRPGQVVGIIRDLFGETVSEVTAPAAGHVVMLRANPLVLPGDSVCLLAKTRTDSGR